MASTTQRILPIVHFNIIKRCFLTTVFQQWNTEHISCWLMFLTYDDNKK